MIKKPIITLRDIFADKTDQKDDNWKPHVVVSKRVFDDGGFPSSYERKAFFYKFSKFLNDLHTLGCTVTIANDWRPRMNWKELGIKKESFPTLSLRELSNSRQDFLIISSGTNVRELTQRGCQTWDRTYLNEEILKKYPSPQ